MTQFLTARLPDVARPGSRRVHRPARVRGRAHRRGDGASGEPRRGPLVPQPTPAPWLRGPDAVLFAKLAAVAAAIAVAVGTFYAYAFTSWASALVSLVLSVVSNFLLLVAGPVVLALGASLTVLGRRKPDRPFAAGVLITGGVLDPPLLRLLERVRVAGPLRGYEGWLLDSADIGVGAGLAMAVAGIALLLRPRARWYPARRRPPATPDQAASDKARGQARAAGDDPLSLHRPAPR